MKHLYQDIARQVVSTIDWQSLGIPKGHGALTVFKSIEKRLWFESCPDLSDLYTGVAILCIYGFLDRARQVGLILSAVPCGTPEVQYSYIHSCFTFPCCFLERSGAIDEAAPLRQLALNPPGAPFRLGPRALDGSMLKAFYADKDYDRKYHAGWPLSDIATLSDMWVMGSTSPEYTKQRIGELIDVNLAEIRSIPKWEPWQ